MIETFRKGPRSKYFYKVSDTKKKKPYTRKRCAACNKSKMMQTRETARFCSHRCQQLGEANSNWKGDQVGCIGAHQRVYVARGRPAQCAWGCTPQNEYFEWANLTGDYENVWDYAEMCRPCHGRYDNSRATMEEYFAGFNIGRRRLTESIVREARARRANGERLKDLAAEYEVANSTLSLAVNGKQWKYV